MRFALEVAVRSVQGFLADKCNIYAAGITYFTLLSIFPLAILALGVAGFFVTDPADQQELIDRMVAELPLEEEAGGEDLGNMISSVVAARGTLGIAGFLGLLYSGSALFTALRTSLNIIFRVDKFRPFWKGKALDLGMIAVLGLLFGLSIGTSFFIRLATTAVEETVGEEAASLTHNLLQISYFIVPPLITLAAFLLVYLIVPAKRYPFRTILVGAVVAALLFEILKGGFTWYVGNFGNYDATYGSIGFIIILLFFVYLSSQLVLLGAETIRATDEVKEAWPLAPADSRVQALKTKVVGFANKVPGINLEGGQPAPGAPGKAEEGIGTSVPSPPFATNERPAARPQSAAVHHDRPSGVLGSIAIGGLAVAATAAVLLRLTNGPGHDNDGS